LKKNHPATLITTAIPGNACSKPETGHLVRMQAAKLFWQRFSTEPRSSIKLFANNCFVSNLMHCLRAVFCGQGL
jgi:hypothetical protein